MDEATLEVKDMSEAFNSRRSELLQSTEKVSQYARKLENVLIIYRRRRI